MQMKPSLGAHLRVALAAAVVLGLCQVVTETVAVAAWTRSFLVGPYSVLGTQMYDFCVKLAAALPVTTELFRGGVLDRFLGQGFLSKLLLCRGFLIPNLLVMGVLGLVIGVLRFVTARPPRLVPVVVSLAIVGMTVHAATFVVTIHRPRSWSPWAAIRSNAHVLISDGAGFAFLVLLIATLAAIVVARLARTGRVVTLGALTGAVALLLMGSTPPRRASLATPAGYESASRVKPDPQIDNILLISIDSLRADRLGCYGNPHDTSPTIDAVARQGIRFANAMSATSWTLPSHMSLLTGRYLLSHGVIRESDRLPDGVPTLAEVLRQNGFQTAGIVSALFLKSQYGFNKGFDYYNDHSATADSAADARRLEPAPVVTKLALKWLRAHYQKRFFLFVHFWDVHYDYVPPPPYDKMFDPNYTGSITGLNFYSNPKVHKGMPKRDLEHLLALYDGEIRWVDGHVKQIISALDDLHIAGRTAVIITADHGDEFFEHGGKTHHRTLYREVLHVPLIMRIPGEKAGVVVHKQVSLVDVMPTLLDLVGAAKPRGMDGVSLMPVIAGESPPPAEPVYAWLCNPTRKTRCQAMQSSDVGTLIYRFKPMRVEFYRPTDVMEQHNVARSSDWPRTTQMNRLVASLNSRYLLEQGLLGRRHKVQIDQGTRDRLRALGY